MKSIDVLLQGHGLPDIAVLTAKPDDTIAAVLIQLKHTSEKEGERFVFLEDVDGPLDGDAVVEELLPLPADDDVLGPLRLHISLCRHIEVAVRFNGENAKRRFPPSATVERVQRWAARRAFHLPPRDPAEHVLQIQGTTIRPDRDVHIGALTQGHACGVAFDLVPCMRVEG
jgi:hypothetical protein